MYLASTASTPMVLAGVLLAGVQRRRWVRWGVEGLDDGV